VVKDEEVAIGAVQVGAAVVRTMFGGSQVRFEKPGGDFATAADVQAEQAILDVLRSNRPDDAVTGEETGRAGASTSDRMWLVDPLCGTLNYAVGNMLVAVNAALRIGSATTVAASADPFADEVFWTDGRSAYLRSDGTDQQLCPSAESRLVEVNLDPPFPNAPGFSAAQLLAETEFVEHFRARVVSTTLAVAWVAAGRRAAYITDGDLRENVHFASGIALCRAAGCVVTGIAGQHVDTAASGLVIAADQQTHDALLALIRSQRSGRQLASGI
jgi:myo-inositol-1(or 4)-monophosphatase